MRNHMNPSIPTDRRYISARSAAIAAAAAAAMSAAAIWALPVAAGTTNEPARSPAIDASLARQLNAEGMSGLSPASLSPVGTCHGLSLASATDCSSDELLGALCAATPSGETVCAGNRP